MKKKTKRIVAVLLSIAFVCLLGSYIIYHIVLRTNSVIKTETAYKETVYETVDATCFVIRDEEFIKNSTEGTTVSFVSNGERVGAGDTVSVIFKSTDDAASYLKINELKKEISHYQALSGLANMQTLNVDSLTRKINNNLYSYLDCVDERNFGLASEKSDSFRDSVTGKQIATGASLDVSEQLAILKNQLSDLELQGVSYSEIKSDNAGYFIGGSDGYENTVSFDDIDEITAEDIENAIKSEPEKINSDVVGRTVSSFTWYIACVLDSDDTVNLSFSKNIYLNFPSSGVEKLPVTLYKLGNRDSGKALVIFACDEMNENLADIRIENIKIITDEYTGLKIPNSAVRTVDGVKGVYIVRGNLMGFRKISVIYSTDEFSVIEISNDSSGYIKLYDQVVTEGVDLYDNKLV